MVWGLAALGIVFQIFCVKKFRVLGTLCYLGMANSRQKRLDKMEVLEKRQEKPKPHFQFREARTPGRFVIDAKRLVLGYDTALTNPVDIQLERGRKIALRGVNGLGKTTLLKTLLGIIPPISGKIELGDFVEPGYFEQESAKGNDHTAIEDVWEEYPGMDASVGGLFLFFQPVVGTFLGWLLLGEPVTRFFWIGSLLIALGVVLAIRGGHSQAPETAAEHR